MIRILLWDVDGTLLDFHAAESAAIKKLFEEFSLGPCSDDMVRRYSHINELYWQRLERNEITKQRVLEGRFEQFFSETGVSPALAPEFNRQYQLRLGDTIVCQDDSINIVRSLRGKVKQYAVSNGTTDVQTKKLKASGLGALMDGIFLSESVGAEKPNSAFFNAVFSEVKPSDLSEVMIVGDSLTSDIRGGNNAGILTCWYNPSFQSAPPEYHINYIITDLQEVPSIIRSSQG